MQLMAMVVGVERGWYTRAATAERILTIMTFLEDTAARFHGAWPHVVNGLTGEPVAFGTYDDAADIVETSYLVQGLLTVRQYFDDPSDPVEAEIRTRATRMWERVEWDWFRRYPDSLTLWWHWSPNHGWAVDLPIRGYHEAMITYLLAIASPTHPMPSESFQQGWASQASYTNGETYYGQVQEISEPLGGRFSSCTTRSWDLIHVSSGMRTQTTLSLVRRSRGFTKRTRLIIRAAGRVIIAGRGADGIGRTGSVSTAFANE
jgi:hypothetical protein